MKYKFNLAPEIRSAVEWHLRYYPEDSRQLEGFKNDMIPSPVQGYSLTAGVDGGEAKRTTEDVAFRIVSSQYIRHLEITCDAIKRALSNFDAVDMKLIELVYWRKEYTVVGAGAKIGLSQTAAYQRINKILGVIAFELGYVRYA